MLTEQQYLHFQTFGFVALRQVFTSDEFKRLDAEFNSALEAAYRHAPFDGTTRHWAPMMGPSTPVFASLLEDARICEVAEQLYGEDTLGIITDANRYVGDTRWHPDTGSIHQFGVKFAFYLEAVGPETGALRIIPGSHKQPFHDKLKQAMPELNMNIQDVPAYICTSELGDVFAFDLRCFHASYGGSDDRRMCTCVYYNNPKTPAQEETTRKQAKNSAKTPTSFNRPDDPIYDPHWLANPEGSAKRQRWLDRMRELGYFEAA